MENTYLVTFIIFNKDNTTSVNSFHVTAKDEAKAKLYADFTIFSHFFDRGPIPRYEIDSVVLV